MSQDALSDTMMDGQGTSSQVTLGEVTFDPVAEQDFRLSVEGTSGVGKSNTLAVILEDLADVAIPTLIVERLGALSPVRLVDEDIVVVGAREEEGVDLAVALEDLDQIGSWVLDRGMKVLLDISTYADYEGDKSRVHLAAANALRALNDRAHEKYRSGDRTKSLLVVDEAQFHFDDSLDVPPEAIRERLETGRHEVLDAFVANDGEHPYLTAEVADAETGDRFRIKLTETGVRVYPTQEGFEKATLRAFVEHVEWALGVECSAEEGAA